MKNLFLVLVFCCVGLRAPGQMLTVTASSPDNTSTIQMVGFLASETLSSGTTYNLNIACTGNAYINGTSTPSGVVISCGTASFSKTQSVAVKGSFPFSGNGIGAVTATLVGGRLQATMSGTGGLTKTIYFDGNYTYSTSYKNTHAYPVYLDFQQDGQSIANVMVAANQTANLSIPTGSHSAVQTHEQQPQFASDNEGNLIQTGGNVDNAIGSPVPPTLTVTSPSPTPIPLTATSTDATSGISGANGPVSWTASQGGSTLDGELFRAGVNKIVAALANTSGSGGGTTIDLTATNAKLDTLHTDLTGTAPTIVAADSSAPGTSDQTVFSSSSVIGLPDHVLPTAPTIVSPGSTSTFALSFTFKGIGFDFGFDLSRYATQIGVFKTLVRAVLAVWFFFLVVKAVRDAAA